MEPNSEAGGLLDTVKSDIEKLSVIVEGIAKSIMDLSYRVGALELEREAEKAQISDNEDLRDKLIEVEEAIGAQSGMMADAQVTLEWANRILPKYFQGDKPVGNFGGFKNIGRDIK